MYVERVLCTGVAGLAVVIMILKNNNLHEKWAVLFVSV